MTSAENDQRLIKRRRLVLLTLLVCLPGIVLLRLDASAFYCWRLRLESGVLPDFDRGVQIVLDLVHHRRLVVLALDFSLGRFSHLTAQDGLHLKFLDARREFQRIAGRVTKGIFAVTKQFATTADKRADH